jgi:hypothetical protein
VLHHITTTLTAPNAAGTEVRNETSAGAIGGQGPGREINLVPKDLGVWVPANSKIAAQTHYTPYGRPTTEATKVGLYFYPKGQEPKYPLRTLGVYGTGITIPAGAEFHPETAYVDIPKDMIVYGLTAHAHVRGGSTQVAIRYPTATRNWCWRCRATTSTGSASSTWRRRSGSRRLADHQPLDLRQLDPQPGNPDPHRRRPSASRPPTRC